MSVYVQHAVTLCIVSHSKSAQQYIQRITVIINALLYVAVDSA